MSIAKAVAHRPVLWLVVFALVCICGLYLFSNIAVDMFPELEAPYLVIVTSYPGADSETVEKSVTDVLEAGLANTGGIIEMTSESREQSSMILIKFSFGTNMDTKMNRVRENIDLVRSTLPDNASAPMMMLAKSNDEPIMRIAVGGNAERGRTQNELRALAKNEIQEQLRQIEGVASCTVEGGQDAVVQVSLSQNRLEAYGITVSEIAGRLAVQNMELGAGSIEEGLVEYTIKTSGEYSSIADISNTVVTQINGVDIRLGDIGEVTLGFAEERSSAYINGESGVYLAVKKQSGANSVTVADQIYARLEKLKTSIPADIELAVIQDSTIQIRDMIAELINSAIFGVALAVLVLIFFFRNINSSIIVGLSIPISFLITLLAMSLMHITINMMTLAGLILGLGMVVDSSIVVLEAITKFREKGETPTIAVILAGEEVLSSIIASTITTLCVFLPIFLFKNQLEFIGLLTQDLIFTVGVSILSSLFVAMFLAPVLASKWFPVHSRIQKPLRNPVLAKIDRAIAHAIDAFTLFYRRLLSKALRHRLITVLLVAAAFIGSVLTLLKLDIEMFPDMDNATVFLGIEMPLGTRYEDTKAAALEMQEYVLAEIKGVKTITTDVGNSGSMDGGNNTAGITITLDLDDPRTDSNNGVKEKLRAHFSAFPNAVFSFTAANGLSDALGGGANIDIVLRADDLQNGIAEAAAVKAMLETQVPEVTDIDVDMKAGLPQVRVNIDRQRAYNMGLNVAAIATEIAMSMNGVTATTFRRNGDEYDVTLRLAKEDRYEILNLGNIFVRSSSGAFFPVSNFASLEKTIAPVSINHEGQARTIHVSAATKENVSVKNVEAKIQVLLDEYGISARFAGESEDMNKLLKNLALVFTLALLLVFGVMAAQYESFRDPFINFCTIPLILIGVTAIHLITGKPLNALTMIGFVMLSGIVVNNGILLVDYTNHLVHQGAQVMDACLEAGTSRFRPVLMTTLTTMMGLAPMAFFPGKSSGMTSPIGLTIFGGLASASVMTLFFVPVLYSLVNGRRLQKASTVA